MVLVNFPIIESCKVMERRPRRIFRYKNLADAMLLSGNIKPGNKRVDN